MGLLFTSMITKSSTSADFILKSRISLHLFRYTRCRAYTSSSIATRVRCIRTLDSAAQLPSDVIDLSNKTEVNIFFPHIKDQLNDHVARIRLCYTGQGARQASNEFHRFPPEAIGCFYFHPDTEGVAEAGEIRFRLFNARSGSTDLLLPTQAPYSIPLIKTATHSLYRPFALQLLHDGLISPDILSSCAKLGLPLKSNVPIVHYLHQPFYLDFTHQKARIYIHGDGRLVDCRLSFVDEMGKFFREYSTKSSVSSMEPVPTNSHYRSLIAGGSGIVAFERSTLPEHKGTRTLVLRILKIIDPVQISSDAVIRKAHQSLIPLFSPFSLLPSSYTGVLKPTTIPAKPWSINVDRAMKLTWGTRFLRLLFPEPLEEWETPLLDKKPFEPPKNSKHRGGEELSSDEEHEREYENDFGTRQGR